MVGNGCIRKGAEEKRYLNGMFWLNHYAYLSILTLCEILYSLPYHSSAVLVIPHVSFLCYSANRYI